MEWAFDFSDTISSHSKSKMHIFEHQSQDDESLNLEFGVLT